MNDTSVFRKESVADHCLFLLLPCEQTMKVPIYSMKTPDVPDITVLSLLSFKNYDQSISVIYKLSNLKYFVIVTIMENESPSMWIPYLHTSFHSCGRYKFSSSNDIYNGIFWWALWTAPFCVYLLSFSALQYPAKTLFWQWISSLWQLHLKLIYLSSCSLSA